MIQVHDKEIQDNFVCNLNFYWGVNQARNIYEYIEKSFEDTCSYENSFKCIWNYKNI